MNLPIFCRIGENCRETGRLEKRELGGRCMYRAARYAKKRRQITHPLVSLAAETYAVQRHLADCE
jgi:hypothetical protein